MRLTRRLMRIEGTDMPLTFANILGGIQFVRRPMIVRRPFELETSQHLSMVVGTGHILYIGILGGGSRLITDFGSEFWVLLICL